MAEIGVMKKLTIGGSTYTIDNGVTSVQVQATSPVQSSTSAAQTSTLNTTISLADGYGDTKNPYASKTKNYVLAAPSNANGVPSFRALVAADIPDLSSTYLTSHQNIKTLHSKTLTGTGDVTLTYSDVGAAASSHAHGNITSGGDITATAPTIANGDQIIINDNSASKITNGPTFDGSTTTKALTPKGTWETFLQSYTESYTGTITEVKTTAGAHTTIDVTSGKAEFNVPTATSHLTNDSGFITSYTDEKLKIAAVTSGTTYYPIVAANSTAAANRQYDATGIAYTGTNGTANGTNGNALLTLGNSTASTTANWKKGTIRLYGTTAYYTDLVSGAPSANRTITFPNATGTVALTSDIPDVSSFVTSSGVTSIATTSPISGGTITSTGTISHATSGVGSAVTTAGFYKFKYDTYGHVTGVTSVAASDITGLVTIPTVPSNIVNTITTTAGAHTAITSQKGDVSFNVPTKTSHLTNDSGFITSDSDENVKSTPIAATEAAGYCIVGSSNANTITGGLSKHSSASIGVSADTATNGNTMLALGNSTPATTAGGKEGQIKLYGTSTGCVLLRAGAPSGTTMITFPTMDGTVALTSQIPSVSGKIDTAGTGLSKSGTTLNHSNSVTAQTTQAVYPIKIDAQGHISAYGSAVTIVNTRGTATSGGTTLSVVNTGDMYTWNNKLDLSGGTVTGPVTFGDSITVDDATLGDLVVTGNASITNNLQANTISGVTVLKLAGFDSINSNYKSINCDVSKSEIQAQDSSLTTSSGDSDWHKALVKAICVKYPSTSNTVFRGILQPSSFKFYEIFIYDTSTVDSTTKLPQYSFGRALSYNKAYYKFGTQSYTWYFDNVNTNTTYSSLDAASGGTDVSLVTTGEKYTWNSKTSNTGTVTSITLTQGTGISIGSSGTAITTSGSRTISLATITKSDTTSTASPAHGGTFTAIDAITYDTYGRVTGVNTKTITLPASGNTDTKVTVAALTSGTTYYPILATGTGTATRQIDSTLKGLQYVSTAGTTDTVGSARLVLGNSTASGTENNEKGILRLYGTTAYYVGITVENSQPTANRTIYLPSYAGTMYLTCTSTTNAVGGSSLPVYVTNTGRIVEVDSLEIGLIEKPFMRATGSTTNVSLSAGTITQVPLTTVEFQGEYSGISLDTTKKAILLEPGYYRVSGSIYFASGPTYSSTQGIYIRMDPISVSFADATEVAASYIYGCISINTSTMVKVIDNCYLWLGARSSVAATIDSDNTATYLTVEKIASVY